MPRPAAQRTAVSVVETDEGYRLRVWCLDCLRTLAKIPDDSATVREILQTGRHRCKPSKTP